jgi:hypothetical protein
MLAIYILAAAIGGVLVVLSAIGGGDHGDGHAEIGTDAHAEIGTDAGSDIAHADGDGGHDADMGWLSFFGLRFWSYFGAFFGLTGLLLTWLTDLGSVMIAAGSGALGLFSGTGVSLGSRLLTSSQTSSAVHGKDLIGVEGVVLVTIKKDAPGKIRCSVRGEVIDLQALTDEAAIPVGREVMIVSHEDHRVKVIPKESLLLQAEKGG